MLQKFNKILCNKEVHANVNWSYYISNLEWRYYHFCLEKENFVSHSKYLKEASCKYTLTYFERKSIQKSSKKKDFCK